MPVQCVVEMNRGGCRAPVLESCRMACTAMCDSCKSSCVRPAASLPSARRRSTSLKLSKDSRSVVASPTHSSTRPLRAYDPIVDQSPLATAQQRTANDQAMHCHGAASQETSDLQRRASYRIEPPNLPATASEQVAFDRRGSATGRSCDGLVNECQIAHNEKRLAKNGGTRWWRVSRADTIAHRWTKVLVLGRDPRTVASRTSSVTISIGSISGLGNTDFRGKLRDRAKLRGGKASC